MSHRALRKLREAEAAAAAAVGGDPDAPEEEEAPPPRGAGGRGGGGNKFALLLPPATSDDDAESADGGASDEDSGGGGGAAAAADLQQQQKHVKKAKKKAKKEKLQAAAVVAEADEFGDLAELRTAEDSPAGASRGDQRKKKELRGGGGCQVKPLLAVDLRLLDGGQELRRLFGQAAGEPVRPAGRRGGVGVRRGLLAQPKPSWPPVVRLGLSMRAEAATFESDAFPPGSCVFRFEHSREYQRSQLAFADAVESGQPERLTEILRHHPYHVDSLLQLAEAFRLQEDAATAADLVERALYAMECALAPGFSLASDQCRLSFARRENRCLFSALLRHAIALAGRCCHRACLETCKLLLSLNPHADPMGALLMLDSACLMCGQEEFLLRLMHAWDPSRRLSQLPNWAYSAALASFRLGRAGAEAALDEALLLFPSVLSPLLARLSVDAGPEVSSCQLFSASADSSAGLRQLCNLYVQRSGHCWKEAAAVSFLVAGAARVRALAAASAAAPPDPRVADYAERRRLRYRRTPLNVLRHLLVSDARDALSDLPGDVDPAGLNSFDPLPPPDSVCDYDIRSLRRQAGGRADSDADGLMAAFLRSLLPSYDPNAPPPAGADGGGGGQFGLAGILDSVRQLLNGLGPPPPPGDGAEEGGH